MVVLVCLVSIQCLPNANVQFLEPFKTISITVSNALADKRSVGAIKLPAALFVVDIKKEFLALEEAKKLGIPIVALIDTNVDPDLVDFKIPANDDAIRSVKLFAQVIANAVVEANGVTEGSTEAPVEEQLAEVATETVSN